MRFITLYNYNFIFLLYYRRDCSHTARYIDMDITSRAKMWELYIVWLRAEHPDQLPVSMHFYRDCLIKHFPHLHLTRPKSDTCKICDQAFLLLKDPSLPIEERSRQQNLLDIHQVFLYFSVYMKQL